MRMALIAWLFVTFSTAATAVPLNSWNLNLGTVGGSNATGITGITLDGGSIVEQNIAGGTAFGNPFAFSGSLSLLQYQSSGSFTPLSFGLPAGYSNLVFDFYGVTGTIDGAGNGGFNLGPNVASLYLNDGSGMGVDLATFTLLGSGSNALDIAYYDGLGGNAFYTLSFQLDWALAGMFTDDQGGQIVPGAVFTITMDGLLDPYILDNPYSIPSIDNTSFSNLLNAGEIGAVNVNSVDPNPVPEPSSLFLLAFGLSGIAMRVRKGS